MGRVEIFNLTQQLNIIGKPGESGPGRGLQIYWLILLAIYAILKNISRRQPALWRELTGQRHRETDDHSRVAGRLTRLRLERKPA